MTTHRIAAIALVALSAASAAHAGDGKKLYCWNENGRKVCGDALPPEAAGTGRTEISAKSGLQTGEVSRSLTDEERTAAALSAEQAQVAADAEAARQRRDLAMVESYATEADLRRAYGDRISLLDDSLKASVLGEANLRLSLASLLNQASDQELSAKPVTPALTAKIRGQHDELVRQSRILAQQQRDRAALDGDLATALERYRALKQAQSADATGAAPATTPPPG